MFPAPAAIQRYDAKIVSTKSIGGNGFHASSERQDVTGQCAFDVQLRENILTLTPDGPPVWVKARIDGSPLGRFEVRPGQLTLTPLGQHFSGCTDGVGSRGEVKLLLEPELVARVAGTDVDPSRIRLVRSMALRNALVLQAMAALGREVEQPGPMGRVYMESLVVLTVAELVRHHSTMADARQPEGLPSRRLRQVTDYIEAHLGQDLSLLSLAAEAGVSPANLARGFKRAMGRSVHQYVLVRRVEWAATLLGGAEQSIAEIALATGFSSQSHLTTAFRRSYGTTPAAYRRQRHR
jgi:AraC family transcriptional regulator